MIYPRTHQPHAATADHYDELDPVYRSLWGEHVHHGLWRTGRESPDEAVLGLSDLVGEQLGFSVGSQLVDIGCGYGATARLLAERGAHVTGFTLSQVQAGRAPPAPNVRILCRDWMDNGLPSASHDGAYAIESSEHMEDKARFFSEARRVLRAGAPLVICAWLANEPALPWQVRHLLEPICREGRLPSLGSVADYVAMADDAGFVCLRYEDLSNSVARTWTICLRRFLARMVTEPALRRLARGARNRDFARSVPRLILAYRTGAMRYGIFSFVAR